MCGKGAKHNKGASPTHRERPHHGYQSRGTGGRWAKAQTSAIQYLLETQHPVGDHRGHCSVTWENVVTGVDPEGSHHKKNLVLSLLF